MVMSNNFYGIGIYMVVATFYSRIVLSLMINMYKYHRFEYYNHIRRMLALYIATLLSFAAILIAFAYGTYGSICMSASNTFFHKEIYSDGNQG